MEKDEQRPVVEPVELRDIDISELKGLIDNTDYEDEQEIEL